jgi:hypothetical protein
MKMSKAEKVAAKAMVRKAFRNEKKKLKRKNKRKAKGAVERKVERKTSAPVSKQRNIVATKPVLAGGRGGSIVVRHREWLQPITSVQTFTGAGRYIIQPGLSDNFPWLGQIAANFENYRFRKCRYVYRNRVATSASFSIYLGVQYDVNDPEFKSIEDIMNYTGSREEVCWRDFTFDVHANKGRLSRQYMVRTDTLPSGLDPTLYDTSLFTICGVGSGTAGTYLGDLLVEYEVELRNPKMNPNLVSAAGAWINTSVSNPTTLAANPLQSAVVWGEHKGFSSDNIPRLDGKTAPTTPSITFPVPGAYQVSYQVDDFGSTGVITANGFSNVTGAEVANSVTTSYAASAGKGISQFCNVITTIPNAKILMNALGATGSSASNLVSWLTVTCEALPYMLSLFSEDPEPPLSRYENLSKFYGKYDLSKMRANYESVKRRMEVARTLADLKSEFKRDLPPIILTRRTEVQPEEAENSDGDVVEMPQPRSKSVDKRSKSSERKQDDR